MERKIFVQLNDGRLANFDDVVFVAWDADQELAEKAHELHREIENGSERTPQKWVEIAERLFFEKYTDIENFFTCYCTTWESEDDVRFECDREGIGVEIYYKDGKIK